MALERAPWPATRSRTKRWARQITRTATLFWRAGAGAVRVLPPLRESGRRLRARAGARLDAVRGSARTRPARALASTDGTVAAPRSLTRGSPQHVTRGSPLLAVLCDTARRRRRHDCFAAELVARPVDAAVSASAQTQSRCERQPTRPLLVPCEHGRPYRPRARSGALGAASQARSQTMRSRSRWASLSTRCGRARLTTGLASEIGRASCRE